MAILVKMKCIFFLLVLSTPGDFLSFPWRMFRPTFDLLDDCWQKAEFIFTTLAKKNNGEQQTNVEQLIAIFQFNFHDERLNINTTAYTFLLEL